MPLLAAGERLLQAMNKILYDDITGQQQCGKDTDSLFCADSGGFGPPTSFAGDLDRIAGAPLPSKMECKKEPVLAIPADLFNSGQYHKGRRRAEWQLISGEGGAKADAWQKLRVCRCHGQCKAIQHVNRRQRLCQNKGTIICRDVYKGFSFYLCEHCACGACQKQQGTEAHDGMCRACARGKGGETVPVSKRPAAKALIFHSRKRAKI